MNGLRSPFETVDFMPHGHCYLWKSDILAMHVGSDLLIGLAYYTIPLALIYFTRKRKDFHFGWMFYMFGGFIFACGTTHLFDVWTTWYPMYRTAGVIKIATAGISVATAIALWPLIPRALAMPSIGTLVESNEALAREVEERERLQTMLREVRSREILTEDRERRKLGTQLHDGLGQTLTLANMQLGVARDRGGEAISEPIQAVATLIKDAQEQIRTLAFELSPPVLHDVGLAAAAEWLAEDVEKRFGLRTRLEADAIPAIASEVVRLTFFRALRELLANAAEHAGVSEVSLRLWAENGRIYGRVADRGHGFDPTRQLSGFGLFSLGEEIRQVGGEFDVTSAAGQGTEVLFWLPNSE